MRFGIRVSLIRRLQSFLFLGSLLVSLCLNLLFSSLSIQALSVDQLVQRGTFAYQVGRYIQAKTDWQTALGQELSASDRQVILENLAQVSHQLGEFPAVVEYWQQALQIAEFLEERSDQTRLQIEQAQAYSHLGQHRQAITLLCGAFGNLPRDRTEPATEPCQSHSALEQARQLNEPSLEIFALGSLGEAHRQIGDYLSAQHYLQTALELSQQQFSREQLGQQQTALLSQQRAILQALGNLRRYQSQLNLRRADVSEEIGELKVAERLRQQGQSQQDEARQYLEQGLRDARPVTDEQAGPDALASQLLFLQSLLSLDRPQDFEDYFQQALEVVEQLPDSQSKASGAIRLAQLLTHANSDTTDECQVILPKAKADGSIWISRSQSESGRSASVEGILRFSG